jgi:hypothetical protein
MYYGKFDLIVSMVDCMVLIFDMPNRAKPWINIRNVLLALTSHIDFISTWYMIDVLTITHRPIVLYI